jgi:hypothetical protein
MHVNSYMDTFIYQSNSSHPHRMTHCNVSVSHHSGYRHVLRGKNRHRIDVAPLLRTCDENPGFRLRLDRALYSTSAFSNVLDNSNVQWAEFMDNAISRIMYWGHFDILIKPSFAEQLVSKSDLCVIGVAARVRVDEEFM